MLKVWHDAAKTLIAVRAHYLGQGDTEHSSHNKPDGDALTRAADNS